MWPARRRRTVVMPNGVQQHPSFQTEPGNLLPPSQSLPLACLKRASVLYSSPQQPLAGFFFAHRIAHTTTQPSPAFTNLQFRPQTESSVASDLLCPLLPGRRSHADLSRLRPDLFESSNLIASSAFSISATPIFHAKLETTQIPDSLLAIRWRPAALTRCPNRQTTSAGQTPAR